MSESISLVFLTKTTNGLSQESVSIFCQLSSQSVFSVSETELQRKQEEGTCA